MIYTMQVFRAMNIAYSAHMGQFDKAGVPYIFHPIHLAEQMDTEEECIVALLHDVVEDTEVTFEDLEKEFSKTIIDAIRLLTRDKSVDYMEYVKNLKSNTIARKVKLADLRHNSDSTRLIKITDKDIERINKYNRAIELLTN